ncbi:MAG TPA: ABC transporter permease subunit [Alphaproteobacteria bacterium]|nr:ABC transporter permease subunit [Alphaproteobacteria bacterium]
MADLSGGRQHSEVVWWRDERKRGLLAQLLVALAAVGFAWFLINNMIVNQAKLGVPLSLSFLSDPAGFQLSFASLSVTLDSPISRILLVGALNTLLASIVASVLATALGVFIGIMRLSTNWLIARIAEVYIEAIRNVPLLLQLVFWYGGVLVALPKPKDALTIADVVFLSVKGLVTPRPIVQGDFWIIAAVFVVGIVAAVFMRRWAKERQARTGQQFPIFWAGLGLVIGLPALVSLALGTPLEWELPQKGTFNFTGGLSFQPEVVALILGLAVSHAAYIAEIVRGGILAVSHGQTEASYALGLRSGITLRLVIIPQALRIIMPPMISQYLNIVKNSTLAGFIGYPDLFSVISTSQNQTGRAVECVAILMLFYLTVSLSISLVMNWFNKRVALVER